MQNTNLQREQTFLFFAISYEILMLMVILATNLPAAHEQKENGGPKSSTFFL